MALALTIHWRFLLKTNADSKVTPELRKQIEQEEMAGQLVADRIAATPTEGQGMRVVDMSQPGDIAVTRDQISDKNREEFAPVIPIGYDYDEDGRVIWSLSPYHYHMVQEGRVCFACLEWQSDFPTLECSWRGKYEGCGAPRQQVNTNELFGRKK